MKKFYSNMRYNISDNTLQNIVIAIAFIGTICGVASCN